jgi:hypothetical protein
VNTCPNPKSWMLCLTRCPLGPLADPRNIGEVVVDSNGRTPGLEEFPNLASWLKNELSLDNLSLMEESNESTSSFHMPNDLSKSAAADSRAMTHFSRCSSVRVNSVSHTVKTVSCVVNPSFISVCMDWISFMSCSNLSLVFGSNTPNLRCHQVYCS